MVVAEIFCVAYICCFIAALAFVAVRYQMRDAFRWGSLRWEHITQDVVGLGPWSLALLRISFAAYIVTTTALAVDSPIRRNADGTVPVSGEALWATYTLWSWIVMGLYFAVAGTVGAVMACSRAADKRAGILGCILWVTFQLLFSVALLVFIIVWLVLFPLAFVTTGGSAGLLDWKALSMHNLNVVFICAEMRVNRLNFMPTHCIFMLLYGCAYVVFSWFWYWYAGMYVYFFLDWRQPMTCIWYTILIMMCWSSFLLGQFLARRMKGRSLPGLFPTGEPTEAVINDALCRNSSQAA